MRQIVVPIALVLTLAAPRPSFADDLEEFEAHLEAGVSAIDAGDYEAGLYELERAREYHDHPLLRYHVARAHEALGECAAAKVQYRVVVENPESPPEIVSRATDALETIDDRCSDNVARRDEPVVDESVPKADGGSRDAWRWVGWGLSASGATIALMGVGKFLLIDKPAVTQWREYFRDGHGCELARDNTLDLSTCSNRSLAATEYDTFQTEIRDAQRSNTILYGTGLTLLAGGVATLTVLALTKKESRVSVAPTPNGVQVLLQF